jgi:anti-sigma-K factor RskA
MANNDPHNNKFKELCAGYVLHALDKDEARKFEQMLVESTKEEYLLYQELLSTANQLAFDIERREPSAGLKDHLMQQIESQGKEIPHQENISTAEEVSNTKDHRDFAWSDLAVPTAFALLIICLSLVFYSLNLSTTLADKEEIISSRESTIAQLNNELQRKENILSILEDRETDIVMMSGLDVNPNGFGKIILNSQKRQALLHVSNLPPSPNDKNYQLWLIKDNKAVSAGIFSVEKEKETFVKIENIAVTTEPSPPSFMVTLEPSGGSQQPSGDTYLMGNMNN